MTSIAEASVKEFYKIIIVQQPKLLREKKKGKGLKA